MRRLVYEGSVKNLYQAKDGELEFEYTDAYSVFDWGRMPDELRGKGKALAAMGCAFFENLGDPKSWKGLKLPEEVAEEYSRDVKDLQEHGLRTHYLGPCGDLGFKVQAVNVEPPEQVKIANRLLYYYSAPRAPERLIPLEVVFRWGMPAGSSLKERLTPSYVRELGLDSLPREGDRFKRPVIELFTKLEQSDRFLTWEQALNYSRLQPLQFKRMLARTEILAFWLRDFFAARGLELWDGKFEWALSRERLVLVDSIGPDELRLVEPESGMPFSKEFLRNFYRGSPWYEDLREAKRRALERGEAQWKNIVIRELGGAPKHLPPLTKKVAEDLYQGLAAAICTGKGADFTTLGKRMQECLAPKP
jgi:phosphoribosylaminoimidazole-succinocarboxamide synthase